MLKERKKEREKVGVEKEREKAKELALLRRPHVVATQRSSSCLVGGKGKSKKMTSISFLFSSALLLSRVLRSPIFTHLADEALGGSQRGAAAGAAVDPRAVELDAEEAAHFVRSRIFFFLFLGLMGEKRKKRYCVRPALVFGACGANSATFLAGMGSSRCRLLSENERETVERVRGGREVEVFFSKRLANAERRSRERKKK